MREIAQRELRLCQALACRVGRSKERAPAQLCEGQRIKFRDKTHSMKPACSGKPREVVGRIPVLIIGRTHDGLAPLVKFDFVRQVRKTRVRARFLPIHALNLSREPAPFKANRGGKDRSRQKDLTHLPVPLTTNRRCFPNTPRSDTDISSCKPWTSR